MTGRAATDAEIDALLAQSAQPPLGQLVASAQNYLAQALAVLRRDVDPASLGDVDPVQVREQLESVAGFLVIAGIGLDRLAGGRQQQETDRPRTAGTDGALYTDLEMTR